MSKRRNPKLVSVQVRDLPSWALDVLRDAAVLAGFRPTNPAIVRYAVTRLAEQAKGTTK